MEKKFKPFERVITRFRDKNWMCDLYSHYNAKINRHVTFGFCYLADDCILPYEGNEHLVGTTDSSDEEVRLEEGEWVAYYDEDDKEFKHWKIGAFKEFVTDPQGGGFFEINTYPKSEHCNFVNQKIVRFSDFNPNDMEETKKHILCVKNGKVIRYKG